MDVLIFRVFILALFINLPTGGFSASKSRFTNIACESYGLDFAEFKSCRLKLIGRGVVGINMHIRLLKVPIYNVTINWSFWRRYNGYKPFLYNASCDFCDLMKHPQKMSFQGLVINAIIPSSNLNHTCPYDHDIIVENLVFTDAFLKNLPLPQGDYKIELKFASDGVWRLRVNIFIQRSE